MTTQILVTSLPFPLRLISSHIDTYLSTAPFLAHSGIHISCSYLDLTARESLSLLFQLQANVGLPLGGL